VRADGCLEIELEQDKEKTTTVAELKSAARMIRREEAEFLLMGMLGLKRHQLYYDSRQMDTKHVQEFWHMVRAVKRGTPVQYLVKKAYFLDLELYVDERVFIPRPETEELVLRAAAWVKNPEVIVDYGTGSGCIAIALARMFPNAEVWAVDVSPQALAVAEMNVRRYRLSERVRLVQTVSPIDSKLNFMRGQVDLLISNPPYIPSGRLHRLSVRVRDYEPRISLDGGAKGVEVVKMLITKGLGQLAPGGVLALEIDHTQGAFVRRLLPGAKVERDLFRKVRYVFYRKEREGGKEMREVKNEVR